MTPDEARKAIECLIFVSKEPLSAARIAEVMGIEIDTVRALVRELAEAYDGTSGLLLREVAGGYEFVTRVAYSEYVEKLSVPKYAPLSAPALETLAVVAYRQPVTRGEIDRIRGVRSESVLQTLLERGLIEEKGRKEGLGRPILYGTTDAFLRYFGLRDLSELPGEYGEEECTD